MGIQGLSKLLNDNAPSCVKERPFEAFFGRKIAVDASCHLYAFLVAVGRVGDQLLSNESGETTSHLQGMLYRTVRMLESGMQPIFVFDGKAPELKRATLGARKDRKDDATESLAAAKESGDQELIERYSKRTVRVTPEMTAECKKLLGLLGVPVVDAATEAEAQCAAMAKAGLVYAIATEDMDGLTFGAPRLIRHLSAPATSATQPTEFDLAEALSGLGMGMDQFVDLCILLGCDYTGNIRGIGPVKALSLIQKHGSIEAVLETLDKEKYPLPEPYPYKESRAFFHEPEVKPLSELPVFKWGVPDEEGLVQFLVHEKMFSEEKVRKAVKRVVDSRGKATQSRMESFFQVMPRAPKPAAAAPAKDAAGKRKIAPAAKGAPGAKKGKSGVGGGKKK